MFFFFLSKIYSASINDWTNIFGKLDYPDEYAYLQSRVSIYENGDYFIYDCTFKNTKSAIVSRTDGYTRVMLESITFDSCYNEKSGGSVFIESFGTSTYLLSHICAYRSHLAAKQNAIGTFAVFHLDKKSENILNFTHSALVKCYKEPAKSFYTLGIDGGKENLNYKSAPGAILAHVYSTLIKFSTFANDTTSGNAILILDQGNYTIKSSSFVSNKSPLVASNVLSKGTVKIIDTQFLSNEMRFIAAVEPGYSLLLNKCYTPSNSRFKGEVQNLNPAEFSQTKEIKMFGTYLCRTYEPTPSPTKESDMK